VILWVGPIISAPDKTGTLTKNLMTVTKIYVEESSSNNIDDSIMKSNTCRLLATGACVNSTAHPKIHHNGNKVDFEQIGNKTECALLEMAHKLNYDFTRIRDKDRRTKSSRPSPSALRKR
jgi:Ca2+ transporting ATPase